MLNELRKVPSAFAIILLNLTMGVGLGLSGIGAALWAKKKQKQDDRLTELQIVKLEAEIAQLKQSSRTTAQRARADA